MAGLVHVSLLAVVAQVDAAPAEQQVSVLAWAYQSLGILYAFLLPASGLMVFLGTCLVVAFSRRPAVIAAYLVIVPLPLLIGIFGSIHGMISMYRVIAMSDSAVKASELSAGFSSSLFCAFVGMLMMFPSYFVTAAGLLIRTALSGRKVPTATTVSHSSGGLDFS